MEQGLQAKLKKDFLSASTFNSAETLVPIANCDSKKDLILDITRLLIDISDLVPKPFAIDMASILKLVIKKAESAVENTKYCYDLVVRLICAAETIVMGLKNKPHGYELGPENLRRFQTMLQRTLEWIEKFQDSKKSRKIWNLLTSDK
ncbi:26073_t:CDS:1, partial [Dentiscutata erythropus]